MTQKKSSNEEVKDEDIEVTIEGDEGQGTEGVRAEAGEGDSGKEAEPPKVEEDVETLRKRIDELKAAQETARFQAEQAQRHAAQMAAQMQTYQKSAEQSQYDSIVTAMGAAQIEVDSAKRDIVLAGASQDYSALADAQERLAAAKAHMVGLEQGKQNYEARKPQQEQNDQLMHSERQWLQSHPEALANPTKKVRLDAAYYEAMDRGLERGSPEYFNLIEERLGYIKPAAPKVEREEESSVMVAAPPSKTSSTSGGGSPRGTHYLTKEEVEIAKLSGITPAEYAKQREELRKQKRINPGDYPER